MLGLLSGGMLTPRLIEGIVRLGSVLPFEQVPAMLHFFTGVKVSTETVRRMTERAGTVQLERETAAGACLERELPEPAVGPALQQLSADGAMVPLVGGLWAEIKTLAIGTVEQDASEWLGQQAHTLRHGDPDDVLACLAAREMDPTTPAEALPEVLRCRLYLTGRRGQLEYARFAAAGYPIGSGMVESANKLLVEARLKGSGMHWARHNVNPLLALRCLERNGRWDVEWPQLWTVWRGQRRDQSVRRRKARPTPREPRIPVETESTTQPLHRTPRQKLVVNGKPTAHHPWRRFSLRHAKS